MTNAEITNLRGVALQEAEYWDSVYQETGKTKDDILAITPNPWIEAVIEVAGARWDKQAQELRSQGYYQIDEE